MSAVAILAADGFETIECLTIVDVLRRGGVRATLVSIMPTRDVISAQQISVSCDCTFDEVDFSEYDYVVLPGGMPGTTNLQTTGACASCARVRRNQARRRYLCSTFHPGPPESA